MPKITFGYWNIRALAESTRTLLEYCGADYEDVRYPLAERNQWFDVKLTLGLDFPNVPYLIDGDVKMSQQWAILRYIGRKYGNLFPKTEEETRRCDMAQEVSKDIWTGMYRMILDHQTFEASKKTYLEETVPNKLKYMEVFLQNSDWMAGATLTYVDFEICERLDMLTELQSNCLDKYPNVKKYKERFFALDKIAAYRSSERFKEYPFFGAVAEWGYKKEN